MLLYTNLEENSPSTYTHILFPAPEKLVLAEGESRRPGILA